MIIVEGKDNNNIGGNGITRLNNIFNLFKDNEYPEHDEILSGPSEDEMFYYVSTTYLGGMVNYIGVFHSIMIRRYLQLAENCNNLGECWENECMRISDKITNDTHSNLSDVGDDVLILGESEKYYWLLWVDKDCSDSCIGKLKKRNFTREQLIDCLHRSVPNIGNCFKEYIVLPQLKGWITL